MSDLIFKQPTKKIPSIPQEKSSGLSKKALQRIGRIKKDLGPKVYRNVQNYSLHSFFQQAHAILRITDSSQATVLWSQFLTDTKNKNTSSYSVKYLSSIWIAKVWSSYPSMLDNAQSVYNKYEVLFEELSAHKQELLDNDPSVSLSEEDELPQSALDTTITLRLNLGLILKGTIQVWIIANL